MREPSIVDVAALAGVSPQTVSRVATGRGSVRADTHAQVVSAMRELGYRPNHAARALRAGRHKAIGVVVFSLSTFGTRSTLQAVGAHAWAHGYSVVLMTLGSATREEVVRAFDRLRQQAVDGVIIVVEAHLVDRSALKASGGLPFVLLDSSDAHDDPVVDSDQSRGARLATEHLLDLGHRTVWHVSGPEDSFAARLRMDAWRAALRARGAHVPRPLLGDWSAASGRVAGLRLARQNDVTAVFCANDEMALGVMHSLHAEGVRIPEEVSIVGFDGTPESASFWPPLTTVRQHFEYIAAAAMVRLFSALEGSGPDVRDPRSVELVVRESTAPPGHPRSRFP